jgi:hypothetical protein
MSSLKSLRNHKPRRASRSSLHLESLERRLPLAGNVTAQLSGSTLFLTGDALDNVLMVASAAGGKMAVIGYPGTTINGSTNAFTTPRAVTSIVANLNGGNDAIGFGNNAAVFGIQIGFLGITLVPPFNAGAVQAAINAAASGVTTFSLPGSLSVTTGDGNDAVGIFGNVGGAVVANLGSAVGPKQGNGFIIGDPDASGASRVGGVVSVVGGAQNDSVWIVKANTGDVSLALGNGRNGAFVYGFGSTIGSFAYTGGTASDYVYLGNDLTVKNSVTVFTGNQGEDEFRLLANVNVGGSVVVNTGTGADDDFIGIGATIRRDLSVTTGSGNDEINVGFSTIGGGVAFNSGAGNDLIGFGNSTVGLNTVIDAGAGNDEVFSENLNVRYNLFVYLGAGNDQLTLNNAKAFAAFLYGGTGTNSLTTNAATRAGIRTLKYYQFQTVTNA